MSTYDDDNTEEEGGLLWATKSAFTDSKGMRLVMTPGEAATEITRLRLIIDRIQDALTMVDDDAQKSGGKVITPAALSCVKAARAAIGRVKGY